MVENRTGVWTGGGKVFRRDSDELPLKVYIPINGGDLGQIKRIARTLQATAGASHWDGKTEATLDTLYSQLRKLATF